MNNKYLTAKQKQDKILQDERQLTDYWRQGLIEYNEYIMRLNTVYNQFTEWLGDEN